MSTSHPLQLGWIGLGSMGLAMALNLHKHLLSKQLPHLAYWNRTITRGQPLLDLEGIRCNSAEEVVQICDVIFISLSDDAAVRSLIEGLISTPELLEGKILVDTTTISPALSSSLTSTLSSYQATFVSAPVFGSTPVAQAGQLLMALGGPAPTLSLIKPYLEGVLARGVIEVGPDPSAAITLKTTGNYITAGLMLLLSEAHVLAEVSSLPAPVLHSLIAQNFGTYAEGVSERLISGAYCPAPGQPPRSGLELGIKDVGNGVEVARENGMTARIGEMYLDAAGEARGWAEEEGKGRKMDSSAVFGVVRERAGLGFETDEVKSRDEGGHGKEEGKR